MQNNKEENQLATLLNWAAGRGYPLEIEENTVFVGDYNCYLRKDGMPPERCIKTFIYGTKLEAANAACVYLSKRHAPKQCEKVPMPEINILASAS